MEIVFQDLTKRFGSQIAVNQINFSVKGGEVLGFLGPNGAGKSTTMKIATGYLAADGGTVLFDGKDIRDSSLDIRNHIGYLPESNPLYLEMYVEEYLRYAGRFFGLKGNDLKERVKKMVEMTGLGPEKHKKIGELSKGYKQRTGLAQALIHDPTYLFLDEPTSGLDPNQILEIRELIRDIGKEKTVVLSTHIMQEVQAICHRVVIIDKGKIIADDDVESLKKEGKNTLVLFVAFSGKMLPEEFGSIDGVIRVERIDDRSVDIEYDPEYDVREKVFDHAAKKNWKIQEMRQKENSLESVFHHLTGK